MILRLRVPYNATCEATSSHLHSRLNATCEATSSHLHSRLISLPHYSLPRPRLLSAALASMQWPTKSHTYQHARMRASLRAEAAHRQTACRRRSPCSRTPPTPAASRRSSPSPSATSSSSDEPRPFLPPPPACCPGPLPRGPPASGRRRPLRRWSVGGPRSGGPGRPGPFPPRASGPVTWPVSPSGAQGLPTPLGHGGRKQAAVAKGSPWPGRICCGHRPAVTRLAAARPWPLSVCLQARLRRARR